MILISSYNPIVYNTYAYLSAKPSATNWDKEHIKNFYDQEKKASINNDEKVTKANTNVAVLVQTGFGPTLQIFNAAGDTTADWTAFICQNITMIPFIVWNV